MAALLLVSLTLVALPTVAQLDGNCGGRLTRAGVAGSAPGQSAIARSRQQQGPCTSSAPEIVDDVFKQVLERPADQASAAMTQELAAGRTTVREIVVQVAKSPEHAERFLWPSVVSAVYRQVLRRDPSPQELRDAASELADGRMQLPELTARTAARAANDEDRAVRILYQRLLGRNPDPEGLRGYTELARRQGIDAVAASIVNSPEYQQRRAANATDIRAYESAVRVLYRHVLARDPDPAGFRDLTRIAATAGFESVVDQMIRSPEYESAFGDYVVPGRAERYCPPNP
jgi:Phycobilisome Linker polypeptide/Domain of unknown function (DUF4214)